MYRHIPKTLTITLALTLSSCVGSNSESGDAAMQEFESRTQSSIPSETSNWKFASVRIRDTYGEYYCFECSETTFLKVTQQLKLEKNALSEYTGGSYWESSAGEANPNAPSWWRVAAPSTTVFHKENFAPTAAGSVMVAWYHHQTQTAYMKRNFWD